MASSEATQAKTERAHGDTLVSVGTSGFSYRDWKGVLYPEWLPARDWFHYYATRFRGVEINLTFYRPPTAQMLERWQQSVPAEFAFVLKASQSITHQRRLAHCGEDLERMVAGYAPLGRQLACILFQLPPSLGADSDRLERFIDLVARSLESTALSPDLAFEFRSVSWNTAETLDLLTRRGCGMVLHDMGNAGGWQWSEDSLKAGKLSLSVPAVGRTAVAAALSALPRHNGQIWWRIRPARSRAFGRTGSLCTRATDPAPRLLQ